MQIALIADDNKKELMAQFCIAYCGILNKHHLCATQQTGSYISNLANLDVEILLSGSTGGGEQILSRIAYDEIDLVFYFRTTEPRDYPGITETNLLRLCDEHNIPVATNLATAEALILALDRGELNWREIINPTSDYNRQH